MRDIVIVGAGGLAREIKCFLDEINEKKNQWNFLGFIDSWGKQKGDEIIDGKIVIGNMDDLNLMQSELYAVIAIGHPDKMKDAAIKITNPNIQIPNLIHPTALVRKDVKLGHGNILSRLCAISCNVEIGNFNFFNGKCGVGHDVKIGNYNVFNPNTQISGNVSIGNENFFGLNSSVLEGKIIGNGNRVGAYTFVMRNIKDNGSYFGIPAKKIEI